MSLYSTKLNRRMINRKILPNGLFIEDASDYPHGAYNPRSNVHFNVIDRSNGTAITLDVFKTLREAWVFVEPINEERERIKMVEYRRVNTIKDAAPDLLAALEVADYWLDVAQSLLNDGRNRGEILQARATVRAALAKARGES